MIKNGKDTKLNQSSGTVPDVSGAMLNWFQKMEFSVLTKTVENFTVNEAQVVYETKGVIQPMKAEELKIKPEGERSWKWWKLHCLPNLELKTDDVVTYLAVQYRVMSKNDYSLYGYYEYDLVEDFTGVGPE